MNTKLKLKIAKLVQKWRIYYYKNILSDCKIESKAKILSPTLFLKNNGEIIIDDSATLGYFPSPLFYSNYNHIETRCASLHSAGGGKTCPLIKRL